MRLSRVASLALLMAVLVPTLAWKGAGAGTAHPIAEVLAKAESGDIVTVEGSVANTTTGAGSLMIVTLQDATGEVLVAVPDSLMRQLDVRMGEAAGGQRYRIVGRWDHKQLEDGTWGIYAQQIERIATP